MRASVSETIPNGTASQCLPQKTFGFAGVEKKLSGRNRRFGLLLGHGENTLDAEQKIGQVVEGKQNARQVCELSESHQIEMPICTQVYLLLENKITPQDAVVNLMSRTVDVE